MLRQDKYNLPVVVTAVTGLEIQIRNFFNSPYFKDFLKEKEEFFYERTDTEMIKQIVNTKSLRMNLALLSQ